MVDRARYAPVAVSQGVEAQLVCDLGGVHGVGQILLVGEHQQHSVPQLILGQHSAQLLAGLANSLAIVAVDDKDEACAPAAREERGGRGYVSKYGGGVAWMRRRSIVWC